MGTLSTEIGEGAVKFFERHNRSPRWVLLGYQDYLELHNETKHPRGCSPPGTIKAIDTPVSIVEIQVDPCIERRQTFLVDTDFSCFNSQSYQRETVSLDEPEKEEEPEGLNETKEHNPAVDNENIRKVLVEEGGRLETGAICVDGDWPGLFLRGDDAIGVSFCLQTALDAIGSLDVLHRSCGIPYRIDDILSSKRLQSLRNLIWDEVLTGSPSLKSRLKDFDNEQQRERLRNEWVSLIRKTIKEELENESGK